MPTILLLFSEVLEVLVVHVFVLYSSSCACSGSEVPNYLEVRASHHLSAGEGLALVHEARLRPAYCGANEERAERVGKRLRESLLARASRIGNDLQHSSEDTLALTCRFW